LIVGVSLASASAPALASGKSGKSSSHQPSKPSDKDLNLHSKGARASTGDKHDRGRERKLQKYNDKKRQSSSWKPR